MLRSDSFEPRHEFIYARVVLHGARTERIHAQINGVVPGRKPREMANHLDFADFRKTFDAFPPMMRTKRLCRVRFWHVGRRQFERALARGRFLEDQAFVLIHVPRGFFDFFVHFFLVLEAAASALVITTLPPARPAAPAPVSLRQQIFRSPRAASFP